MKIRYAFERHSVPVKAYSKPGEFIALRHTMKNFQGRDSGLAAVIRAVVDGSLVPAGYNKQFRGITGYFFLSKDLHKYRPVPDVTVPPEGSLNYRETASMLGTKTRALKSGALGRNALILRAKARTQPVAAAQRTLVFAWVLGSSSRRPTWILNALHRIAPAFGALASRLPLAFAEKGDEYEPTSSTLVKFAGGTVGKVTSSLECVMPYTFNIPLMGEQGTVRNNQFFTSCWPGQTGWAMIPTILPDRSAVTHHPFADAINQGA